MTICIGAGKYVLGARDGAQVFPVNLSEMAIQCPIRYLSSTIGAHARGAFRDDSVLAVAVGSIDKGWRGRSRCRFERSQREHLEILRAVADRNPDEAETAMLRHLRNTGIWMQQLRDSAFGTESSPG